MTTFMLAVALVLVIEGLGPLLFPNRWKAYLAQLSQMPTEQLRRVAGTLVTIGLVSLVFLL